MAINIDTVADSTSTVPANSEAKEDTSGLPTEILELPIFAGLLQGAPAALWTPTGDKTPESLAAVKNQKALSDIGIFLYRDKKSKLDLIYNGQFISKELIDKAAEKGRLKDVASPLAETLAAINGAAAPEAGGGGGALPAAGPPSSVPVDSSLNTARVNALEPGGPTSGRFPGSGRVLNEITKSVV